ncbi:ComEA family DNA-binding protein [Pontibacter vulgaris]|uniref:ComEA family DNA-binding protein n=1 Tax=Pontibacter vulgaris TaxID=2905679 RepID=UPI001FA7D3A7|nr:helix-hairpin-helix domain-containing protein [Pontibacter vulgaris]
MNKIKRIIRRYFGFSQREVNGFLLLILLMVLLTAAPFLFSILYQPDASKHTAASDQRMLDSLVAQLEARQPEKGYRSKYNFPAVALHPFNPNELTVEQWQALGLPKYMAQRILNYRNKVGDFTYKAELGKIYGLPDSTFRKLYPYIQLPEDRPSKYKTGQAYVSNTTRPAWNNNRYPREKFILAPFDINTADTTKLKQIRGIGSKLSARIIKYRDKLGGFHSMAQLKEVYGLQPDVVDSLVKYSYVRAAQASINGLSLNKATVEQLNAHPYISPNVARAIVAYRQQHGEYKALEEVRNVKIVSQELYDKLKPYLVL